MKICPMKSFYILCALLLLASCGQATPENNESQVHVNEKAEEQTAADIDASLDEIPESTTGDQEVSGDTDLPANQDAAEISVVSEPKVVELSTTYNNPKIEVVMDIAYSVDSEGKITEIAVTSPNYGGMPEFNSWVQGVVGMTVSEASEYHVSGSSLTTPAFQAALKNG